MKKEKPELDSKKLIDEQITVKSAESKKKKKDKLPDEALTSPPKVIKSKSVKSEKAIAKPKAQAPKDDKLKAPKEDKLKAPKEDKLKAPKEDKLKAPKEDKLKAPKEDKLTKFLVSMKKSVRKSIKKEAADVGVSMNEYIVLAVVEKLDKNSLGGTK